MSSLVTECSLSLPEFSQFLKMFGGRVLPSTPPALHTHTPVATPLHLTCSVTVIMVNPVLFCDFSCLIVFCIILSYLHLTCLSTIYVVYPVSLLSLCFVIFFTSDGLHFMHLFTFIQGSTISMPSHS